jgi:glycosyltransferase involved in cell wall biosynthesis
MKASIITPAMNSSKFIDNCIRNVAEQGEAVEEHIVADGGSTDGTVERIMELANTYSHVKLLKGPDLGQSDALNKASEIATGDVIGILNVDDFYEKGAVSEALNVIDRIRGPCFVAGNCRVIDENGATTMWNRPIDLRLEALLLGWPYAFYPHNPSAYFYTRQVHKLVGGYDVEDHYAMDLTFILACVATVPAKYVNSHWGNFRLAAGCKTFEDRELGSRRVRDIIERHRRQLSLVQKIRMQAIKFRANLYNGRQSFKKRVLHAIRR